MADWNNPLLSSTYSDFLSLMKARDEDAVTMCYSAPTNTVQYTMRFNRSTNVFQEWDSGWSDKVLAILGGGTGSTTASGARTNLGLGTMAVQNGNAVSITGGSIAPTTTFNMKCNLEFDADDTYNIGTTSKRPSIVYIKSGLCIPVGVNKWVP